MYLVGDHVAESLNDRALSVMREHGVPVLDLNTVVRQHCGQSYRIRDICDNETEYNPDPSVYCGYHYTAEGYTLLAEAAADSFAKILEIPFVVSLV